MTVRREIAKPRRETGARSPEDLRRTRGPPAAGLSQQRIGDCSRRVHE